MEILVIWSVFGRICRKMILPITLIFAACWSPGSVEIHCNEKRACTYMKRERHIRARHSTRDDTPYAFCMHECHTSHLLSCRLHSFFPFVRTNTKDGGVVALCNKSQGAAPKWSLQWHLTSSSVPFSFDHLHTLCLLMPAFMFWFMCISTEKTWVSNNIPTNPIKTSAQCHHSVM